MNHMRELGSSGIWVAPIALGTWAVGGGPWWGATDDGESIAAIHAALDNGVNLVDTAPTYYFGHSEEVVGRALEDRRDKAVLATKCGLPWDGDRGPVWYEQDGKTVRSCVEPASIRRELEQSLRRLRTDYIDLYQIHLPAQPPLLTPVAETMGELMKMKAEGKIRAIGVSNETAAGLAKWAAAGVLDACQNKYSMLVRDAEKEVLPHCAANGIAFLGYQPFEQGLLTGKIRMDTPLNPEHFRSTIPWYKPENRARVIAMLDGWAEICAAHACTTAQLVAAWTAAQPGVTAVLCGARRVKNALENAGAASLVLSSDEVARMRTDLLSLCGA